MPPSGRGAIVPGTQRTPREADDGSDRDSGRRRVPGRGAARPGLAQDAAPPRRRPPPPRLRVRRARRLARRRRPRRARLPARARGRDLPVSAQAADREASPPRRGALRDHAWSPPERALVIAAIAIALGSLFVTTYSLALGDPFPRHIDAALVGDAAANPG